MCVCLCLQITCEQVKEFTMTISTFHGKFSEEGPGTVGSDLDEGTVHVYVCTCVCVCACVCACMRVCVRAYLYVCTACIRIYVFMYICTYIHIIIIMHMYIA